MALITGVTTTSETSVPVTSAPVVVVSNFVAPLYCNATPVELFTIGVDTDDDAARLGAENAVVAEAVPVTVTPEAVERSFVAPAC